MGHPRQRVRAEGHQWWQVRGVAECNDSEIRERQRAWAEVIAAKAASGESRSVRSTQRCSVDMGAAGKHKEENEKGKPSALSSQRL
jgi:hypothetical protein